MSDYLLSDDFIKRFGKREKMAFQLLFEKYYWPLCFFSARMINDRSAAEDIVQDVFINLWKQDFKTFPNFKTIKTFLYNSVQNRSLNYLRDLDIRDRNYRQLGTPETEEHVMYQQIRSEVVTEIFTAIEELPEKCRNIFKMAYMENQEEKEIAVYFNISVNTVKTQKLRAKNYLKTRLGDLFIFLWILFPDF